MPDSPLPRSPMPLLSRANPGDLVQKYLLSATGTKVKQTAWGVSRGLNVVSSLGEGRLESDRTGERVGRIPAAACDLILPTGVF